MLHHQVSFFLKKRYEFQRTKIFLRPLPKNCLFWIGLDLKGDRELNVRVEWFGCQYQFNDFFSSKSCGRIRKCDCKICFLVKFDDKNKRQQKFVEDNFETK